MGALAAVLAIALAAPQPAAADRPAGDEPRPWTLDAFAAAAQAADPRALAAAADLARLRALEARERAAQLPALDWIVSADGPIPELKNDPNHLDDVAPQSRLRNGTWGSWGVHGHVGANLTWPVFTFGRASASGQAAARGAAAGAGVAAAARARAARDAAEIWWSWQLARRSVAAIDELDRQLAGARDRVDQLVARGSAQASKQDLAQLDVVRAEIAMRRAEAIAARDLAVESGRLVVGAPADAPFAFAPASVDPPALALAPVARYQEAALAHRPDVAASRDAVAAREATALARRRAAYPELDVIGFADLNWTGVATPQTNPFAWDPYNRLWGGLGLALRGTLDLGRTSAAAAEAEAEVEKARAEADLVARTARLEVARAHGALRLALERAGRLRDQEAAAKRWLSQAELSFDAGLAEAQAVLLAALGASRAGTERVAAARDAQLALADLALAVGEDPRLVAPAR